MRTDDEIQRERCRKRAMTGGKERKRENPCGAELVIAANNRASATTAETARRRGGASIKCAALRCL